MNILQKIFSRRWILTTLLAIAACAVMVRLGIWQLDRLEKRRAFNERVYAQQTREPFVLDAGTLNLDLSEMEYREVFVTGEFVNADEVVLRNQVYGGRPGFRLFTPLRIAGTDVYVMIDRGFVPSDQYGTDWERFPVEGEIMVHGIIRRGQTSPDFGGRPDPTPQPGEKLSFWNIANLEQMEKQLDYELLSVYVQVKPVEGQTIEPGEGPVPFLLELELTEGPHMGYAVQWFLFAAILGLGYPVFIKRESQRDDEAKA